MHGRYRISSSTTTDDADNKQSNLMWPSLLSIYSIIKTTQTRAMQRDDIETLSPKYNALFVFKTFNVAWNKQVTQSPLSPSLLLTILHFIGIRKCLFYLTWCSLYWVLTLVLFKFLHDLLLWTSIDKHNAYLYVTAIGICCCLMAIQHRIYSYQTSTITSSIRAAITCMIITKCLKISNHSLQVTQIIHLISNDIQPLIRCFRLFPAIISAPITLCLALLYFCHYWNQWILSFGVIPPICMMFIRCAFDGCIGKCKVQIARFINEIITQITELFENTDKTMHSDESITDTLKLYMIYVRHLWIIKAFSVCMNTSYNVIILMIVFVPCCYYYANTFNVICLYPVLTIYWMVKIPITIWIPQFIQSYRASKTGSKRIIDFLMRMELEEKVRTNSNWSTPELSLQLMAFSWSGNNRTDPTLADVCIRIAYNEFVGVCGDTKSTLLLAMIGELERMDCTQSYMLGKASYCSQKPWIYHGSIQENILFGKCLEPKWYNKVLFCCALEDELKCLDEGDQTIMDEGCNISDSMAAKINLARAVYQRSQIILLDDPFALLNAQDMDHVFKYVLSNDSGLTSHSLRVLVTSHAPFLSVTDRVFIVEEGMIVYNDLFENSTILKEMLSNTYAQNRTCQPPPLIRASQSISSASNQDDQIFENIVQNVESSGPRLPFVVDALSTQIFKGDYLKCIITLLLVFISQCYVIFCEYLLIYAPSKSQIQYQFLVIYILLIMVSIVLDVTSVISTFLTIITGASVAYGTLIKRVLKNTTHIDVLQVFLKLSRDQIHIDQQLPISAFWSVASFCQCSIVFGLIGFVHIYLYVLLIPIVIIIIWFSRMYLRASKSLLRLELDSRSAILSHIRSVYNGLSTIRTNEKQMYMLHRVLNGIDAHIPVQLTLDACSQWLRFIIDICVCVMLTAVCFLRVYFADAISVNAVGITVMHLLMLSTIFQSSLNQTLKTETCMDLVNGIVEYSRDMDTSETSLQMSSSKPVKQALKTNDGIFYKMYHSAIKADRKRLMETLSDLSSCSFNS